jgi:hypothetical protein
MTETPISSHDDQGEEPPGAPPPGQGNGKPRDGRSQPGQDEGGTAAGNDDAPHDAGTHDAGSDDAGSDGTGQAGGPGTADAQLGGQVPGPALAVALRAAAGSDGAALGGLSDGELLEVIQGGRRMISWAT